MGEGKGGGNRPESPGNFARRVLGGDAIGPDGRLRPRFRDANTRRRLRRGGVAFDAQGYALPENQQPRV